MLVQHFYRLDRDRPMPYMIRFAGSKLMPRFLPIHILQEFQQHLRALLTRFHRERLPVQRGMVADPPHQIPDGYVLRIALVFGNKSDMAGDTLDADRRGKVAHVLGALLAFGSRILWDEADRLLYGRDIRIALAGVGAEDGHDREVLLLERVAPRLRGAFQRHVARYSELPHRYAERLHLPQRLHADRGPPRT